MWVLTLVRLRRKQGEQGKGCGSERSRREGGDVAWSVSFVKLTFQVQCQAAEGPTTCKKKLAREHSTAQHSTAFHGNSSRFEITKSQFDVFYAEERNHLRVPTNTHTAQTEDRPKTLLFWLLTLTFELFVQLLLTPKPERQPPDASEQSTHPRIQLIV